VSGLQAIGSFLLELEDPAGAWPYLQTTAAGGSFEAIVDLLVMALFEAMWPSATARALLEAELAM
jgi:hypothetical protein